MMPAFLASVTLGQLGVVLSCLVFVYMVLRKVLPWLRNLVHFIDDITGEAARRGNPARPGLLERQSALETSVADIQAAVQQLRPNGGKSVKDQLNRLDALAQRVNDQLNDVRATTRALQMTYDTHSLHSGQAELEIRSALAELQHKAFKG